MSGSGEWWSASDSAVLHWREIHVAHGLLDTTEFYGARSLCSRPLRWTGRDEEAKRTDRCGFCSFRMAGNYPSGAELARRAVVWR